MIPYHWSLMKKLIWLKKAILSGAIWKTVTGSLIRITDALASPVNALSVNIAPVQSGSGDPSPDNVRPISGWTGAKVNRTGKNLLRLIESEMTSSGWDKRFPFSIKAGTYTFSCQNQFGATAEKLGVGLRFLDSDGNVVRSAWASAYNFGNTIMSGQISFTAEQAAQIVKISMTPRASGLSYQEIMDGQLMLEVGETATAYEAYSGTTIPITFPTPPGTVYGGTLNVTTGVLTVDKRYITFSSGATLYGNYGTDNAPLYYIIIPTGPAIKRAVYSTDNSKLICNYFRFITTPSDTAMLDGEIRTRGTNTPDRFYFRWDGAASADAINAAFANTPLQVIADLQSPQTYQLTPQEVSTLLGENNIWADTGDTTLTYMAMG